MYRITLLGLLPAVCFCLACGTTLFGTSGGQQNPYLALSDTFGIDIVEELEDLDAAQGAVTQTTFRLPLAVTLTNNHTTANLDAAFVAWINVGNVRSTEQANALFRSGYRQLTDEISIGSAFTLPTGTYVYDGGGFAGATAIRLGSTTNAALSNTVDVELITPDAFVVLGQPPVSCDSVAFTFTRNGQPLSAEPLAGGIGPYGGANTSGGFKTLAQVNLYQCDPLRPGLFLRIGGITDAQNEYLEGADVLFEFNAEPDDDGNFGIITIS